GREIAQVEQHVETLGRSDEGLSAGTGRRQKATIVADQRERKRLAVGGSPAESIGPRIGSVEHAEAVEPRGEREWRAARAVDQHAIAEEAVHLVHLRCAVIT